MTGYRPGVWECIYYPETDSTHVVPDVYRHRDYSSDFDTKPAWSNPPEDAEGYIEWAGGGGNAMDWRTEEPEESTDDMLTATPSDRLPPRRQP